MNLDLLFESYISLIEEDASSSRKPIIKLDQMNAHQFVNFMRKFLPYVNNGKVDMNSVRITEKIDGAAFMVLTSMKNDELLFESSYGGIKTWEEVPFKDAAKFFYDKYKKDFLEIARSIETDFKLRGELLYVDPEDTSSSTVTPVCASYLKEKLGTHGGIVVFEIREVKDMMSEANELVLNELGEVERELAFLPEEKEEQLVSMLKKYSSDPDFQIYMADEIDLTDKVNFELDPAELLQALSKPEYDAPRYKAATTAEINQIKDKVVAQLSKTIDSTRGRFSDVSSMIEGIVLKMKDTGEQVGMFSQGYKAAKEPIWKAFNALDALRKEFKVVVFGTDRKAKIFPQLDMDIDFFREAFEQNYQTYLEKMKALLAEVENDSSIPYSAHHTQMAMGQRIVKKMEENSDYRSFLQNCLYYAPKPEAQAEEPVEQEPSQIAVAESAKKNNSFKLILESYVKGLKKERRSESGKSILKEGGNVKFFKDENSIETSRIRRANIPLTIEAFKKEVLDILQVPEDMYTFEIGSAGKKDTSGDLDCAFDYGKVAALKGTTEEEVKEEFKSLLKSKDVIFALNSNLINICYPISGDQPGEYVQIDIIPTHNIKFTKYRMYSPSPEESKYKAKFRLILLQKIVKVLTEREASDNNGETFTTRSGRISPVTFSHTSMNNDGIWDVTKTWKGKRVAFLKDPKKLKERSVYLHDDPQRLLDELFGPGAFKTSDTNSFESIWNNILFSDKIAPETRARIITSYYFGLIKEREDFLKRHPEKDEAYIEQEYPIPSEVTEWLQKNAPEVFAVPVEEIDGDND